MNYNFAHIGGSLQVTGGAAQAIIFAPLPNFTSGGTYQLTARGAIRAQPLAIPFTLIRVTHKNTLLS